MSDSPLSPIYTTLDSVQVRLAGKVSFQAKDEAITNPRQMPYNLCCQLIVDAETAVEQDLRGRYAIPFRSKKTNDWLGLPDHSRRAIRSAIDEKAVEFILRESFGAGSHVTGDGYIKNSQDKYEDLLRRLLGQDMENESFGEKRFRRSPPLDDVVLSSRNVADDGFFGIPGDSVAKRPGERNGLDYAANQINDPSRGLFWFGGRRGTY